MKSIIAEYEQLQTEARKQKHHSNFRKLQLYRDCVLQYLNYLSMLVKSRADDFKNKEEIIKKSGFEVMQTGDSK